MRLAQRDRKIMWHPLTQEKTADLPIAIVRGKDHYIFDEDGKRYVDLISSWWVNLHGHSNIQIAEAIYQQALTLEHVIFPGFTHTPAVNLCEQLQALLPSSLSRFFFSDNGATSVEIALKMAYQYFWNKGNRERKIFLSFEGAYHGDTFGAMSVGKTSGFYEPFMDMLFQIETIPYPYTWIGDVTIEQREESALQRLKEYLNIMGDKVVALILEPIIQGMRGMRMCRPSFLQAVIDCVRQYNILVIFDEVMTGFYRTGTPFALSQVQRAPDIICLSKGLTGGFMPLGLTVVTEEIYNAFLDDSFDKAFTHSHSYTANPLGCAAAIASLDILQDAKTLKRIHDISLMHEECLAQYIAGLPNVVATRVCGTIAAFNLFETATNYGDIRTSGLKRKFLESGFLLRPLGNTIYLMPPYCIDVYELKEAYQSIAKIVTEYCA